MPVAFLLEISTVLAYRYQTLPSTVLSRFSLVQNEPVVAIANEIMLIFLPCERNWLDISNI